MAPFGEFVAPRGIELRAAQRFRILGRERLRHRAVRPFEAPARRDPRRSLGARRNPQDSGDAFDHHLAGIVLALADQCDMAVAALRIGRRAVRCGAHPLGAEPCLAGAAPAQHQPGGPWGAIVGGLRRLLVRMRQRREVTARPQHLRQRRLLRQRVHQSGCRQTRVCAAQTRDGIHRCLGACRHRQVRCRGEDRCAGGRAHAGSASMSPACVRSAPRRLPGAAASPALLRAVSSASSSRSTSRSMRAIGSPLSRSSPRKRGPRAAIEDGAFGSGFPLTRE